MADFRRVLTALAVLALLTGFAVSANAQATPAFACTATAVTPQLRAEGVTELIGDIVLNCSGGTNITTGTVPTANFAVFMANTNITSRLISGSTSESLLLVDEPASAAMSGAGSTGCGSTATNANTGCTVAAASTQNVYQGVVSGNSVTFIGVPVNPPGTASSRIFRITNVRINASALGGSFAANQVLALVTITASTSIPVTNSTLTVGFVQAGLTSQLRNSDSSDTQGGVSVNQCADLKSTAQARTLRFTEGFANAFKVQSTAAGQAQVGFIYNTESGLVVNPSGLAQPSTTLGLANFGTRLKATFRNIPAGVTVWVSTGSQSSSSSTATAALVASETAGNTTINTPFLQTSTDTISSTPAFKLTLDSTGTGSAVWEVTAASSLAIENLDFRVWFGFSANPAGNSPPAGVQGTVTLSFAPTGSGSTWISASTSLPIPRFVDLSTPKNVIVANICRTTLLYPFVTAANGFDTGIAIANTTDDGGLFATPQSGTCTLTFFGDNAPSAFTTPTAVAGGKVYVNVASSIAPGFQGYMIARCNFQYAHGFAFVQSTVGYTPSTAAMGYLPLVLIFDRASGTETLTH